MFCLRCLQPLCKQRQLPSRFSWPRPALIRPFPFCFFYYLYEGNVGVPLTSSWVQATSSHLVQSELLFSRFAASFLLQVTILLSFWWETEIRKEIKLLKNENLYKVGWLPQQESKKGHLISQDAHLTLILSPCHRQTLCLAGVLPQTDGSSCPNSTCHRIGTDCVRPRKGTETTLREVNSEPRSCVSIGIEGSLGHPLTQPTADKPKSAVLLMKHSFAVLHKGVKFPYSHVHTLLAAFWYFQSKHSLTKEGKMLSQVQYNLFFNHCRSKKSPSPYSGYRGSCLSFLFRFTLGIRNVESNDDYYTDNTHD